MTVLARGPCTPRSGGDSAAEVERGVLGADRGGAGDAQTAGAQSRIGAAALGDVRRPAAFDGVLAVGHRGLGSAADAAAGVAQLERDLRVPGPADPRGDVRRAATERAAGEAPAVAQ